LSRSSSPRRIFKPGKRKTEYRPPKGYGGEPEAPARPVTLPVIQFLQRPEIPASPREVLGRKCREDAPAAAQFMANLKAAINGMTAPPPVTVSQGGAGPKGTTQQLLIPLPPQPPAPDPSPSPMTQAEANAAALLLEGEIAWQRLRSSPMLQDWLAVGRALLILRGQAVAQSGCYKGIKYAKANAALLDKHGFREITRSTRQCAMLVVENWPAIERWIAGFEVDRRLNHPLVIWRGWLASKRAPRNTGRHATDGNWRNREPTKPVVVQQIVGALKRWFPDEEADDYRSCAHEISRIFGYAVPRSQFRRNGAGAHS